MEQGSIVRIAMADLMKRSKVRKPKRAGARYIEDIAEACLYESYLKEFAPALRDRIQAEKRLPTKAQVRKHFDRVTRAALVVRDAISVEASLDHLSYFGSIENQEEIVNFLHDLASRANLLAEAAPWLVGRDGKAKRGPGKARGPRAISAKLYCAAVTFEVRTYLDGSEPSEGNLQIGSEAAAFWRSCGGDRKGWGRDEREGWKHYYSQMDTPIVGAVRADCRRRLRQIYGSRSAAEAA